MNTNNTDNWWYASNQQKYGPFSEDWLRELAKNGQIRADDLVWRHGLDNWISASSVDGLIPPTPVLTESETSELVGINVPENQPRENAADEASPFVQASAQKISVTQIKAFVDQNYDYYERQWKRSESNILSWNWGAFFFGVLWMAYRKMYLPCALFVGTVLGIMTIAMLFDLPQNTLQAVLQTLHGSFFALFGLLGNQVYKWHVQRKLRQILSNTPPQEVQQQITQQGGVSLMSVLSVAMSILLTVMSLDALLVFFALIPKP